MSHPLFTRKQVAHDEAMRQNAKEQRLGHCTPMWGGHSPACNRDGTYCSKVSTHDGPCAPHGSPR